MSGPPLTASGPRITPATRRLEPDGGCNRHMVFTLRVHVTRHCSSRRPRRHARTPTGVRGPVSGASPTGRVATEKVNVRSGTGRHPRPVWTSPLGRTAGLPGRTRRPRTTRADRSMPPPEGLGEGRRTLRLQLTHRPGGVRRRAVVVEDVLGFRGNQARPSGVDFQNGGGVPPATPRTDSPTSSMNAAR